MVTLENIGRSPAHNVRIGTKSLTVPRVHAEESGRFDELDIPIENMEKWSAILPGDQAQGQQLIFLKWAEGSGPSNADGGVPHKALHPVIGVNVTYEFGEGRRGRTARAFWIGVPNSKNIDQLDPIWNYYSETLQGLKARPGLQSEVE